MHRGTGRSDGWLVIVPYTLVCAATQMLWLTYAAITTDTAHTYGVSVSAVGWLSEIFPLLYVVLALPAGLLLDRWFRPVLAVSGGLVAAGGLLRLGGETFAFALAGQTAVAVAQPAVMSAVSKLAGEYLPADQRATGIAVGSAGGFAGMLLALLIGPLIGGHGELQTLLVVDAVLAAVPALWMAVALRRPGTEGVPEAVMEEGAVRRLWRVPTMRTLSGLVFLGFGIFVALATWLQTLLQPSGVSETQAGVLLVAMMIAGIVGCAALPPLIDARGVECGFMRSAVLVSAAGCIGLGVVPSLAGRIAIIAVMGVMLLPALPIVLTHAERIGGPAAGTAGAIVWMAGNLGGLVVALLVQALVHEPMAAFLALAVVVLLGWPLAGRLRGLHAGPAEIAPVAAA